MNRSINAVSVFNGIAVIATASIPVITSFWSRRPYKVPISFPRLIVTAVTLVCMTSLPLSGLFVTMARDYGWTRPWAYMLGGAWIGDLSLLSTYLSLSMTINNDIVSSSGTVSLVLGATCGWVYWQILFRSKADDAFTSHSGMNQT